MKKLIVIGLATGALMLIINMIVGAALHSLAPSIQAEYQNPQLFRPWTDPLMMLMFVQPFMVGLLLTWLWTKVGHLFTANAAWQRGLSFGLVYWLFTLPGMVISYGSFPLSLMLVVSWTTSGLLQAVCASIFLGSVLKSKASS